MANLVAAVASEGSQEIAADYLCRAAAAGLAGGFTEPLMAELCMLALLRAHSFALSMDALLNHVVSVPRPGTPAPLKAYLVSLPDEMLVATANCLLNVAGKVKDISLSEEVRTHLMNRTDSAAEPFAGEVRELVELVELQADLRSGARIDVDENLDGWKKRRKSQQYPWLLHLLFQARPTPSDRLVDETAKLLSRQTEPVTWSSWIHLARYTVHVLTGPSYEIFGDDRHAKAVQAAVRFLRREYPDWRTQLDVDVNIDILGLLVSLDPAQRANYIRQLEEWEVRRQMRDGLRKLPSLIQAAQYFLIYWHYFDTLDRWGLSSELPVTELRKRLSLPPEARPAAIKAWRQDGGRVPDAMLYRSNGSYLNSEFLILGHYLFSKPCENDPDLDDARARFNEEARRAVKRVYQELVEMPSMPKDLRAIIKRHRDQLITDGVGDVDARRT